MQRVRNGGGEQPLHTLHIFPSITQSAPLTESVLGLGIWDFQDGDDAT